MDEKIMQFRGEYSFLSNMYETPVMLFGVIYPSSEAAFQAAKCDDENDRNMFRNLSGVEAKKLGRRIRMRADWEYVKEGVMFNVVLDKFQRNPELGKKLLETGDAMLVEGNTLGDTFWGVDLRKNCGKNRLGYTLMKVRDYLRNNNEH